MAKKPVYSGVLMKPIIAPPGTGLLGAKLREDAIASEQWSRLVALFEFFKIDPQDPARWTMLALELANRHVPGMRVEQASKTGRPMKWDLKAMRELVDAIDKVEQTRKLGIWDAVKIVKKANPSWGAAKGLERRYYESKTEISKAEELRAKWESIFPDRLLGQTTAKS